MVADSGATGSGSARPQVDLAVGRIAGQHRQQRSRVVDGRLHVARRAIDVSNRANCSVTRVEPKVLDEVISVISEICPSARSSGVATVDAMVSGLAPGNEACTEIVGKSTAGSGETGSSRNAIAPASATPMVNRVVATGRSTNMREGFTRPTPYPARRISPAPRRRSEQEKDHRDGEQSEHLTHDQAAHHGDAERTAQLGAHSAGQHERQRAEQGQRGRDDRPGRSRQA